VGGRFARERAPLSAPCVGQFYSLSFSHTVPLCLARHLPYRSPRVFPRIRAPFSPPPCHTTTSIIRGSGRGTLKPVTSFTTTKANPGEQGTFEYWWASPKVHRTTWSRASASRTDWYTSGGKYVYLTGGDALSFIEYKLQSALLSPLSEACDLDPSKIRLQFEEEKLGGQVKFPCVEVIPLMPQYGHLQPVPMGLFPPVLRVSDSFGALVINFNQIAKVQNRFLPREIALFEGNRQILSAKVESVNGIVASDPALVPAPDSHFAGSQPVSLKETVTTGMLLKKEVPVYPQDAKDARQSGEVVLTATIGTDGRVHDLQVKGDPPWPSLAASSLSAVSQWQYKPYLLNAQPIEVETTITVNFSLGP